MEDDKEKKAKIPETKPSYTMPALFVSIFVVLWIGIAFRRFYLAHNPLRCYSCHYFLDTSDYYCTIDQSLLVDRSVKECSKEDTVCGVMRFTVLYNYNGRKQADYGIIRDCFSSQPLEYQFPPTYLKGNSFMAGNSYQISNDSLKVELTVDGETCEGFNGCNANIANNDYLASPPVKRFISLLKGLIPGKNSSEVGGDDRKGPLGGLFGR